ncbi:MAG: DNA polymerase III subunit alpha [Magnetococcales bacterium]|nr:DNA polymerase III subunit alpha [Magnetococcales bacterium]MBF0347600.1 DNA polymerase III subunit alpha [Magnetococcales bacterium]
MNPPFVHLHVHSGYSLLASTIRLERLIERTVQEGMPALALTDQGNLFAAIQFYSACIKEGIKPILGAQVYLVADRREMSVRPDLETRDQLILLCKNTQGWKNLMALISIGHLEGSHDKPRIDLETLERHRDGLLGLSAGIRGEVGRHLSTGCRQEARDAARRYQRIFDPGPDEAPGFYLELQRHQLPGEESLIQETMALAMELNLPIVATNDCHFLDPSGQKGHDALTCIGLGATLYQENRQPLNDRYHFASIQEMRHLFADLPEACDNTLQIARRCNVRLELGHTVLPDYHPPEGKDLASWLRQSAAEGLDRRLIVEVLPRTPEEQRDEVTRQYRQRLDFELDVILQMGFPGYFLIVSDFIRWAKNNDIPVGPGRGSGAGSLVAWSLDITDLDPIRYQLLFERFLNPERVSMPDFDVDFCMDKRERVIGYVQERYGHDRMAQIITFGTLQARAVIRDVGRVLEFPYGQVDKIAKLVPNTLGITLKEAIQQEERLAAMMKEDPGVRDLLELALELEGLPRSAGTHAAGVVMANGPLTDMVPLYRDPRSNIPVTQFNMSDVEKAGLVKFDFLGLKTLTVIDTALKMINTPRLAANLAPIDIRLIDLDDRKTFTLLQDGQTRGVFQLESSGMREILKKLAPDTFEDIVALVALYRPGPLGSGMVDDFINRKHGRTEVVYPWPTLEPILKETYGVILYQEQVMKIAQVLAGYSLGSADLLRRAMGKKKREEMLSQREIFLKGAEANDIPAKKAEYIFDLMEKFAGYGFNKSHSAAYALISYQTAWLKAHYPVEFLAATLTCDILNTDKVTLFVRECQTMKVPVWPPDINQSNTTFTVENGGIRYGLLAIKNVGAAALEKIIERRQRDGAFRSLYHLCDQAADAGINRRMMEHLIKSGACDALSTHRAALLDALPDALTRSSKKRENRDLGFMSLFDAHEQDPPLPSVPPLDHALSLQYEKESLGFYMTGHPMDKYLTELQEYGIMGMRRLRDQFEERIEIQGSIRVAGLVTDRKLHRTRKGDRMAFLTLEDPDGHLEVVVFSDVYHHCRDLLEGDAVLVVTGTLGADEEEPKLMAEEVISLDGYRQRHCRELRLRLPFSWISDSNLEQLATILKNHAGGQCRVIAILELPTAQVTTRFGKVFNINPDERLLADLCRLWPQEQISFSAHTTPAA